MSKDQQDRETHKDLDRMAMDVPDKNTGEFAAKFDHEPAMILLR